MPPPPLRCARNYGMSMAMVMVLSGVVGGLSLVMLRTLDIVNKRGREASNLLDEAGLRKTVEDLLADPRHCKVSLAGGTSDPPVTFKKADIDGVGDTGMAVELYASNSAGTARGGKKLSGTDNAKKKFGKLTVDSIRLVLDSSTGAHTNNQTNEDTGVVNVGYTLKVGKHTKSKTAAFRVSVEANTDNSGVSTLTACMALEGGNPRANINCSPGYAVSGFDDKGVPICSAVTANKRCPAGQHARGFDADSNLICYTPEGGADEYPTEGCFGKTEAGCKLYNTAIGYSDGVCSPGYAGSCSYSCGTTKTWTKTSNSCVRQLPECFLLSGTTTCPSGYTKVGSDSQFLIYAALYTDTTCTAGPKYIARGTGISNAVYPTMEQQKGIQWAQLTKQFAGTFSSTLYSWGGRGGATCTHTGTPSRSTCAHTTSPISIGTTSFLSTYYYVTPNLGIPNNRYKHHPTGLGSHLSNPLCTLAKANLVFNVATLDKSSTSGAVCCAN